MVVNAMEGEPASDKDKLLLTRVPHLVLDGAQLIGAAFGADRVVVCIPAGCDGIADVVRAAMAERVALSYACIPELITRPPGRFVSGEESALAQWIQAGVSLPSFRPDKSVALRIGKCLALVQNAETLAHVCPDRSRSYGPKTLPGLGAWSRRTGHHAGHHFRCR